MGSLWLDVEVYADLLELLAELDKEGQAKNDELPSIMIDCPPSCEDWETA